MPKQLRFHMFQYSYTLLPCLGWCSITVSITWLGWANGKTFSPGNYLLCINKTFCCNGHNWFKDSQEHPLSDKCYQGQIILTQHITELSDNIINYPNSGFNAINDLLLIKVWRHGLIYSNLPVTPSIFWSKDTFYQQHHLNSRHLTCHRWEYVVTYVVLVHLTNKEA